MISAATFGASVPAGVCHPHKPTPSAAVHRLQVALQGLSRRTGDRAMSTPADGLVGSHTIKATNRAMTKYAGTAPAQFTTGQLTHAQIVAFAAQLAAIVERAPSSAEDDAPAPMEPAASAPAQASAPSASASPVLTTLLPAIAQSLAPPRFAPVPPGALPSGGQMYPYPRRGPGGLPTDRATLDVKAFVPAQYEHIRIHPGAVMAVAAAVVITVLVVQRKKGAKA